MNSSGGAGGRRTVPTVAFEGLDGTGKSRMIEVLSQHGGFIARRTPGEEYASLRERVHHLPLASLMMYLSSCALAIEEPPPDGQRIAVDRYVFSSVLHYGWSAGLDDSNTVQLLFSCHCLLPMPRLTVLLTADRRARLIRLRRRNDQGLGDPSAEFEEFWFACAGRLLTSAKPGSVITLNTDGDDCEHLVMEVLAALKEIKE